MQRPLDARRPVALFANGIGDHLLNLPTLRALSALYPNRLRLVCMPGARATFFRNLPLLDALEAEFVREGSAREFDADALAARIGRCDLFLSLVPWHSDSMNRLLGLLAPTHSKGFHPAFQDRLLLDYSKHSAELAFDLPKRIDRTLNFEAFAGAPSWPVKAAHQAEQIRCEVPAGMSLLAVHADTLAEKMWPVERWTAFLDAILDRFSRVFVVVVGRRPLRLDRGRHRSRVVPCHGLPLATSLALVGSADLFVGVDSCMLHAADLCRVPGIGLFGPTNPAEFGFRLAPHRHVIGDRTMASISVDRVVSAFEEINRERADAGGAGRARARRGRALPESGRLIQETPPGRIAKA